MHFANLCDNFNLSSWFPGARKERLKSDVSAGLDKHLGVNHTVMSE